MKLEFQEISIRNFLSFGNIEQTLPLNNEDYQVIVGQNRDKSDSSNDRNGVGKSTIFEAIHYALFGKSIGNKVTLGNLVNNLNKKNMVVTLRFKKDDVSYEITRGRSPNILKLLRNGEDIVSDESQGDSRETQKEIEHILGMNEDIYNQIVCLSCKIPVFLDQSSTNQKAIIEKILGVDIISKKVESLKSLIKETKNEFNNEQFRYNTIKTQNDNLMASINQQINDMNVAKQKWVSDIQTKIENAKTAISQLELIDIENELNNFQLLEQYLKLEGVNQQNQQMKESLKRLIKEKDLMIANHQMRIADLLKYDFVEERQNILYNESLNKERVAYDIEENTYKQNKIFKEQNLDYNFQRVSKEIEKKKLELENIKEDVCPTCGQPMNVEAVNKIKEQKKEEIKKLQDELHKIDMEILEVNHLLSSFVPKTFEFKTAHFNDMNTLLDRENELNQLKLKLENYVRERNELIEQDNNIVINDIGNKPVTYYKTIQEAIQHQTTLGALKSGLAELEKSLELNPFEQQEKSIEEMKKNILEVDDTMLRSIQDKMIVQDTLLKLLNSPSSFVRKAILDKSLAFLNAKIMEYLEALGSLHIVSFNNDMTIDISYMGVEYGYVSSGEMGRISTALTLAFRDAWESLNNCKINLLAMDEVIDRIGLDTSGVEMMVSELKKQSDKNVMIVSHNETIINQAPKLLTLIKEQGFTTIDKGE